MIALKERAPLSFALLARKHDLVSAILSPGRDPDSFNNSGAVDSKSAMTVPLFFRKGEASAEQFRPRNHFAPHPIAVTTATAAGIREFPMPSGCSRTRLWMRSSPERRQELKLTAARLGRTSQDFLVEAIDVFMRRRGAELPADASSLASPRRSRPPLPSFRACRVKLAVRVDEGRRDAMKRLAARTGQTVQTVFSTALDEHLERAALQQIQPSAGRPFVLFPAKLPASPRPLRPCA